MRTDGGVKRVAGAEFVLYKEGGSEFYVPDPERYSQDGLPTRDAPVAFAPNAAVNRSVLVLFHRVRPVRRFGDVFCGVGARAIRLHIEAEVEWSVLSDVNPIACQIAMINVRRLGLPSEVRCMDAVAALSTFDFDAVDLDVFGTPIPFAQAAFRCVRDVTCTSPPQTSNRCIPRRPAANISSRTAPSAGHGSRGPGCGRSLSALSGFS